MAIPLSAVIARLRSRASTPHIRGLHSAVQCAPWSSRTDCVRSRTSVGCCRPGSTSIIRSSTSHTLLRNLLRASSCYTFSRPAFFGLAPSPMQTRVCQEDISISPPREGHSCLRRLHHRDKVHADDNLRLPQPWRRGVSVKGERVPSTPRTVQMISSREGRPSVGVSQVGDQC